jgi:DNA-binding MarR family transcriptional regulator
MPNEFQKDATFDHQSAIDNRIAEEADCCRFQELQQALAMAEQAPGGTEPLGTFAALVLAWRSKIDSIFEFDGFAATPAWDIMLGLYQAQTTGGSLTLKDVAFLSSCAPSTVSRWVSALEDMQLLKRVKPANGSPEPIISLAGDGRRKTEMALRLCL